jgi:pyrroloquinoline-quinone synthase
MTTEVFLSRLDDCIRKYDLLCHPFYKAWSAGELTRQDLRDYAEDYYHHVEAFPTYLAELGVCPRKARRGAPVSEYDRRKGRRRLPAIPSSHAELWLDFVEGMGGSRAEAAARAEVRGPFTLPSHRRGALKTKCWQRFTQ